LVGERREKGGRLGGQRQRRRPVLALHPYASYRVGARAISHSSCEGERRGRGGEENGDVRVEGEVKF
jgi:hypothetical protein